MRIADIYINNYRAFYGDHHIALDKDGKNLMLYGENGSGKSSLFTALKDFFLSSVQQLKVVEENIFIAASRRNTAYIKVNIRESGPASKSVMFELNSVQREIVSDDKGVISDANKIKGFFDYRSLLKTHIDHKDQVDLFKIIVSDVLYHSINRFSSKEIGREWDAIHSDTFDKMQTRQQQELTKAYLKDKFNPGLKELLQSIEKDTNTFLKYFGINIDLKLAFNGVVYHGRRNLTGNRIELNIDFNGKYIPKHQLFLNEARLTALAISLYLASVKINPTKGTLKVLVLDDLLIGLDMSNRLPLLDLLKEHFIEVKADDRFQILMTTYDKVWYELVKSYYGVEKWKFVEVYSKRLIDDDFDIPIIKHDNGYLEIAKRHLDEKDFKAAAVYLRTEFERLIKSICDKQRLPVAYRKNQKEVTTDEFWNAIESQTNLDPELVKEIRVHRGVVMNPFSHYDLEKPEFEKELRDTIKSIEKLKSIRPDSLRKVVIDQLRDEVRDLGSKLAAKDKLISDMGEKLKTK